MALSVFVWIVPVQGTGFPRSLRQLAARGRARTITPPPENEAETWTDEWAGV